MKQINLLPLEVRQRAVKQQTVPFLVLSVIIASAAVGVVWFILNQTITTTKDTLTKRQDQAQTDVTTANKAAQAGSISADLQNRITQINTLSKNDIDWDKTFTYIGQLIPQDIYLSGYTVGTASNAVTIQVTGQSPSNLSFAQFMESLRTSKRVQKATVVSYSYDATKGTVAFSVSWQAPTDQIAYTP